MNSITTSALLSAATSHITRGMTLLMAVPCGLIVAKICYVQPLAGLIATALGLPPFATGIQ